MKNLQSRISSIVKTPIIQKSWSVLCLLLAITAQQMIKNSQQSLPAESNGILSLLNEKYYLSLKNPRLVLSSLFLAGGTAFLFNRLLRSKEAPDFQPDIEAIAITPWKKSVPWLLGSLAVYLFVMVQLARHEESNLLAWAWATAILIFTYFFWKNENRSKVSISRIDLAWMIGLFAFAVSVGAYLLNDLPAGWIADELPFWGTAREILLGELNPSFFDIGVFTFPVASSYLQAWIMSWAGMDFTGWRFSSVLPAAATIIPLYLLSNELFGRRTAIAACVFMSVNPYFLAFARLGYNNSQSLLPVTLCIYLFTIGLRKNNYLYLWLAGLAAGLGFYTYFSAWLGLVVIFLTGLYLFVRAEKKSASALLPMGIVLLGALTMILPRILYGMSGELAPSLGYKIWETGPVNTFYGKFVFGDERISQTRLLTVNEVEIFYDPFLYWILLVRGVVRTAAALFDPIGYYDHQILFGLAGIGSAVFFILGLGAVFRKPENLETIVPALWFLSGFFFLGVIASIPPRPTHLVAIIPVLALIAAVGLVSWIENITISSKPGQININLKKWLTGGILTAIAGISLFQYFFMVPVVLSPPNQDDYLAWLGRQANEPAKIILIDHIATFHNPEDEVLVELTHHEVISVISTELEKNRGEIATWKNFIAFVGGRKGINYAQSLADQIPGATVQPAFTPGKRPRGYVISDLDINASMDVNLSYGLKSLWNSPARGVLFLCMGILMVLGILPWKDKNSSSNTEQKPS